MIVNKTPDYLELDLDFGTRELITWLKEQGRYPDETAVIRAALARLSDEELARLNEERRRHELSKHSYVRPDNLG